MSEIQMQELLRQIQDRGASDLILTPGTPPQFRINGLLSEMNTAKLTPADTERLAHSLMNEKQVETFQRHRSLDFSIGVEGLSRFRVNAFHQRGVVAVAVRIIPFTIPSFEELGLPDIIRHFASRPHGLFLVTGPAGMGKSTTLAAMIDYVNHRKHVHIVCIEDPIEYVHAHHRSIVNQREVLEDARSFSEALRSVFRQTPDIIMVGEMRDLETIRLALTLAETGHLILATLHTHDTTNAIARIVDVFPVHQQQQVYTQLSMVLVGVVSQILLPKRDDTGRVLACEVMNVNNAIRNLIREHQVQQIYSTIQMGKDEGMLTMNDSLRDLCRRSLIDPRLALEKSPRPKELRKMLEEMGAGLAPKSIFEAV